jgi:ADP-ribose pyrophosphatase YjhB (NUDIX family)
MPNSRETQSITDRSTETASVVTLIRDEEGRLLLTALSEDGPWSCLGGPISNDETLEEAAIRFALEDCGISVELKNVVAHLSGDKYQVLYECGQNTSWRATVIEAFLVRPVPPNTSQMFMNWFSRNEIMNLYLDEFAAAALPDLGLM